MGLDFASSTAIVDFGSPAIFDDKLTVWWGAWIFVDAVAADARVMQKGYSAAHSTAHYLGFDVSTAGSIDYSFQRATTPQSITALRANFAAYGTGKWIFVIAIADASTNGSCKLYIGDLYTPPAEPSAYTTQIAGAGAATTDAAAPLVWGQRGGSAVNFDGKIAWVGGGTTLPANQGVINQIWMGRYRGSDRILDSQLGWNGTTSAVDWSGLGNNGTITSATVYAHVPARGLFGGKSGWRGNYRIPSATTWPGYQSPFGWS